jgi:hypothetical protein
LIASFRSKKEENIEKTNEEKLKTDACYNKFKLFFLAGTDSFTKKWTLNNLLELEISITANDMSTMM